MPVVTIDKEMLLTKLQIYLDIDLLREKIENCKGLSLFQMLAAVPEVFMIVIKTAERIVSDAGAIGHGADKRAAVVEFLKSIINFSFPVSLFKGKIIGLIVDTMIWMCNWLLGHRWIANAVTNIK